MPEFTRTTRRLAAIALAPLALAACGDAELDSAATLADCEADLAALIEERDAFVAETSGDLGQLRASLDGGTVSIDEMEQFAELQSRLEEFENRLSVQQIRCDEMAAGQE